jgi:hypothetical protein
VILTSKTFAKGKKKEKNVKRKRAKNVKTR